MADFYSKVPRELEANLRYRLELRRRASKDLGFRKAMLSACREDALFFFAAFCWVYEPRPKIVDGKKQSYVLPFIPWPHQVPAIRTIKEHLGLDDIGMEKSRGEGASWMAILLAVHDWLFVPMSAIGLVSRNERMADDPDNPDSLGWKISWELEKLPTWMVPKFKRSVQEHNWKNLGNGSSITAYAATGDVARGGRRSWFLMDELAAFPASEAYEALTSTHQVTNSRFIVSTPQGSAGAYYDAMHDPSTLKIVLDWKDNPTRNRGLYRILNNKVVVYDPTNNPLPPGYETECRPILDRLRRKGFKLEGKFRSPWYDKQCDRPLATPQSIAQELDRDYGGSVHRVFSPEFFAKAEETVRKPFHRMRLSHHPETLEADLEESEDGALLLWLPLDVNKQPPRSQYVLGVDICAGLGGSHSSNSSIFGLDAVTMEQVLEYTLNTEEPTEFADTCMAIGQWLGDAYLIWEVNYGGAFGRRVMQHGYPNIYYRDVLWKKGKKKRREVGWWTDDKNRGVMFGELSQSVRSAQLSLRSKRMVEECGQYVLTGEGKIVHEASVNTRDESGRGRAHGDRVVAGCLALQGAKDRPAHKRDDKEPWEMDDPPQGTMAARQRDYEMMVKSSTDEWDGRGLDSDW